MVLLFLMHRVGLFKNEGLETFRAHCLIVREPRHKARTWRPLRCAARNAPPFLGGGAGRALVGTWRSARAGLGEFRSEAAATRRSVELERWGGGGSFSGKPLLCACE